MSNKSDCLYDGMKIYDTPKFGNPNPKVYPGFNGPCYDACESYPTHGVGSAWRNTAYWEEKLFYRVLSVLEFKIPETWDRDYTLWILFRVGFFGIIPARSRRPGGPRYGNIPQYCTFYGRNVFYQPTRILVSNPAILNEEFYLQDIAGHKRNAALIKLTPGYTGCWDTVHYHAEKLAILSQALDMAILNSRISKAYLADGNAMAQTMLTINDMMDQGIPIVSLTKDSVPLTKDGKFPIYEINGEVGKNYIVDKLQAAILAQLQAFDRDIGVPVMDPKKERRITGEVEMEEKSTMTAIDVWYDTLTRTIEKAKEVFPDLEFSVARPKMEGGPVNVNADPAEPAQGNAD